MLRRFLNWNVPPALALILFVLPIAAQVQQSSSATGAPNGAAYSAVPMPVVYELFIKEFVGLQDFAGRLEAKGRSARETRALLRSLTGLNEADLQLFSSAARDCVSKMNQANDELKDIAGKVSGAAMNQSTSARVSELWQARRNAPIEAMDEVRLRLDSKTFAKLEQRMRQHVVANLSARPAPPASGNGRK